MKLFSSRLNKKDSLKTHGFTLVEFVVIMGIFAIMIGVIMANFNGFKSIITLDNLAQDVALAIRQVQTSAGASQSFNNEPDQEYSRGIVFTPSADGGYKSEFILYETSSPNGVYTEGVDRIIDIIKVQTLDKITGISYFGPNTTFETRTEASLEPLSISFKRYITSARFSLLLNQTTTCIELVSSDINNPKTRSVCVSKLGQISVH